jgi:ribosome biogenesis GTPase
MSDAPDAPSPADADAPAEVAPTGDAPTGDAPTDDAPTDDAPERTGTVLSSTGSWYEVETDDGDTIRARVRGKFRLDETNVTNPVAVGDRVTLRVSPEDGTGLITAIGERDTRLSRRAAGHRSGQEHVIVANVDFAWAVQAVRKPRFNPGFIDRFLVMAEVNDLPAGLVVNKFDLLRPKDEEAVAELVGIYEAIGYPVLLTSAETGAGVDAFRDALAERTSVVTGPSGVGKSSLLNAVEPGLDAATGEVSAKTQKGKHTTTFARLHPLSVGGYLVDTPGIREFGILALHPADLAHFFVEFVPYLDACKFDDCTHDHEPGCAVKDAVDAGAIHLRRYESYLNILYSLQEGEGVVGY